MVPVDLKERYGRRYRVVREMQSPDPWYCRLLCRYGHIYPHSDTELGYSSDKRGPVANKVAALPYARVTQDSDEGLNIVFPADKFKEVARIVHPRTKRRLSEERKAALREASRSYWFPPGCERP